MIGKLTVALTISGLLLGASGSAPIRPANDDGAVQLVENGKPVCAIIYPAQQGQWQTLARQLADAIAALGSGRVRLVADTDAVPQRLGPIRRDLQDLSLILLGDLNSNRAVFPFYANYYTCCDALYPGQAGYELRTIVRPFGGDRNCLIVGSSDAAGARAAVEQLTARLKSLPPGRDVGLPYLLEVKLGKEMAALFAPAFEWVRPSADAEPPDRRAGQALGLDVFTYAAHLYFYTGSEDFARRCREAILNLIVGDKNSIGIGDYTMENLAAAWRRARVSPVFTPQERARIDRSLFGTASAQSKAWWRVSDASKGIGCRHHTTGMLAWWTLVRVLLEVGNLDSDMREQLHQWRAEAEAYLDGLSRHYADDQDDYQAVDSAQNTASYCLQSGKLAWFHNGLAEQSARKLLAITDNRGFYAGIQGYGEALPGWERFMLNGGLLLGSCAFVYQDKAYDEALKRFPSLRTSWGSLQPAGIHQYAGSRPLGPAKDKLAPFLDVIRLTSYRLALMNIGDFLHSPLMDGYAVTGLSAPQANAETAFDKVVVRGTGPENVYLLLQGFSGTALSTIDMNSIIRCTDLDRLWLVHNTGRRSLYYKNAVHVSNGVDDRPLPAACELLGHADFGDTAMVASRLPDNRGTVWTRYLFVLPDRFTLVLDRLRVDKPGEYVASCNWRTPGFASLHGPRWESVQDNVTFSIESAAPAECWSARSPVRDGAVRPTILRERKVLSAKGGEEIHFANLIHASSPSRLGRYEVHQIAPNAVLVVPTLGQPVGSDVPLLPAGVCLLAIGEKGIDLGTLQTDAKMLLLSTDRACLLQGSSVQLEGVTFTAESGRIAPQGEWTGKINHLLMSLLQQTSKTQTQPTSATQPAMTDTVRSVWTHPAPGSRGGLIDGVRLIGDRNVSGPSILATDWILPLLRAEPRLRSGSSGGFDLTPPELRKSVRPSGSSMLAEVNLAPLKDAAFRLILPRQSTIGEISLFGESAGEDAPPLAPAEMSFELTFSNDGFDKDARKQTVRASREPTHHALYKGHDYVFECYRLGGLNQVAREIRVRVLNAPTAEMPLSEVQIRTAGSGGVQPVQIRPIDLNSDGSDEILAWTSEGGLSILNADGSQQWHKSWPEGIVTVDVWDLEDDGRREVFISRGDRAVDVLNADGSLRWHRDFSQMRKETHGEMYGDGSLVYGMVAWKPDGFAEKQVLCTSYFFSARLDAKGQLQEYFRRDGHQASIRPVPPRFATAGQFAIRCDIPWVGPVPLEWWGGKTNQPQSRCSVPNGPLAFFELDDYDADGQVEALFASEEGVGLYGRGKYPVKWQHSTDAPCVGAAAVRLHPRGPATIVYGREDGYVFVVRHDGKVVTSRLLDEPLVCLTALQTSTGQTAVLAGTRTTLRCLNVEDLSEQWRQPGSYRQLELLTVKGAKQVLAITPDGTLESLSF